MPRDHRDSRTSEGSANDWIQIRGEAMSKLFRSLLLLASMGAMFTAASEETSAGPFERFIDQAKAYHDKLKPAVADYRKSVLKCSSRTQALGSLYDEVLTIPSSQDRDACIARYNEQQDDIRAMQLTVETETKTMDTSLKEARDFLERKENAQWSDIPGYQKLEAVIEEGEDASWKAKWIPQLRSLPDPIPAAIPQGKVLSVDFDDEDLAIGKMQPVEVTVKNNCHYRTNEYQILIFSRPQNVAFEEPTKKPVTVAPGESGTITWNFSPKDNEPFRIFAKIVDVTEQ